MTILKFYGFIAWLALITDVILLFATGGNPIFGIGFLATFAWRGIIEDFEWCEIHKNVTIRHHIYWVIIL